MLSTDIEFSRNLGFVTSAEQQRLMDSDIAIAGVGGDGGMLAELLTRMGVGSVRLADPDPFESENINRQVACNTDTLGVNKAIAVGNYLQSINPNMKITTYTDGVTPDNVDEFTHGADLVIDESEFSLHALGVMIARAARAKDIPNLMALNIGYGTLVTSYHPKGRTLEKALGLNEDAPLDEIAEAEVSVSRWLAHIPSYGDLDVFLKASNGEKSVPTVAPGVAIAAGTAATQAMLHLLGPGNRRPLPVFSPRTIALDVMSGDYRIVKHPRASFAYSIGKMALRSKLGLNPKTSY